MPEIRHHSGLRIFTEPAHVTGCQTGRGWDKVVQAMIKSGELFLHEGEVVTGVIVDPQYGLMFCIDRLPARAK